MNGVILLLSLYALTAWTGKTLPFLPKEGNDKVNRIRSVYKHSFVQSFEMELCSNGCCPLCAVNTGPSASGSVASSVVMCGLRAQLDTVGLLHDN